MTAIFYEGRRFGVTRGQRIMVCKQGLTCTHNCLDFANNVKVAFAYGEKNEIVIRGYRAKLHMLIYISKELNIPILIHHS